LKTAVGTVASVVAIVGGTGDAGAQALIVPASESKMNRAGVGVPATSTLNPVVGLNTWPVGAPAGIVTTSGAIAIGMPPTAPG